MRVCGLQIRVIGVALGIVPVEFLVFTINNIAVVSDKRFNSEIQGLGYF